MFPESSERDAESLLPDCVRRACKAARRVPTFGATRRRKETSLALCEQGHGVAVVPILWEFNDFLCTGVYHRARLQRSELERRRQHTGVVRGDADGFGVLRLGRDKDDEVCGDARFSRAATNANDLRKLRGQRLQPTSIATHLCGSACGACGGTTARCYASFVEQVKKRTKKLVVATSDLTTKRRTFGTAFRAAFKSSKTKSVSKSSSDAVDLERDIGSDSATLEKMGDEGSACDQEALSKQDRVLVYAILTTWPDASVDRERIQRGGDTHRGGGVRFGGGSGALPAARTNARRRNAAGGFGRPGVPVRSLPSRTCARRGPGGGGKNDPGIPTSSTRRRSR